MDFHENCVDILQKPTKIDFETIDKCTDTNDLVVEEPSPSFVVNVKSEQKTTKRIKREPRPRKRTKKSRKQEEDDGNICLVDYQ